MRVGCPTVPVCPGLISVQDVGLSELKPGGPGKPGQLLATEEGGREDKGLVKPERKASQPAPSRGPAAASQPHVSQPSNSGLPLPDTEEFPGTWGGWMGQQGCELAGETGS